MSFHSNHGLYFQRRPNGDVWIEKRVPLVESATDDHSSSGLFAVADHWELTPNDWASTVSSMTAGGETASTFRTALHFHQSR